MHQAGTTTREFAQEFKQHTQDVGMAEEETKVHLISVLDQDTLTHLDAYISMSGGDEMAHP